MNDLTFIAKLAKPRRGGFSLLILPIAFYLSACASFDAGSNLQRGRYALLRGDSKLALQHFQRTSEIDPNYHYRIGPMKEGVWTYVGRAHYSGGDYKAAQKALELARTRHPDDSFAPLYLGLALSRDGDRQRAGRKEIQLGLTGLNDWLEYIDQYTSRRPSLLGSRCDHPQGHPERNREYQRQRGQLDRADCRGRTRRHRSRN